MYIIPHFVVVAGLRYCTKMQDVIGNADTRTAASKARDNELAKIMFEGWKSVPEKAKAS